MPAEGTAFAVTTMGSEGGVLRIACATGAGAAAETAAAGFTAATGFAGAAAFAAGALVADFAGLFATTGFVAGFFAVNFGFSTFFGFADFAAARLVGIGVAPGPYSDGGRFAGRGIIPATFCLYSRFKAPTLRVFFDPESG
jgi:hypothetical protein